MQPYDMFGGEKKPMKSKKQKIVIGILATLGVLIFIGVIVGIIIVPTVQAKKNINKEEQQEPVATEAYRRRRY